MKTGLLLLQSIAPSALRSGRSSYTVRQWSDRASRAGSGAAFLAATAAAAGVTLVGGVDRDRARASSAVAMCSSNLSHSDTRDDGAATKTTTVAVAISSNENKRSIDEPDKDPEHNPLLPFPESALRHDTYNGVTLDLTTLTSGASAGSVSVSPTSAQLMDADAFGTMLRQALDIWSSEERRGIWMKVPTTHSHLIAPATELGFDFQHAEPGYCVLTKWLPKETASRPPCHPLCHSPPLPWTSPPPPSTGMGTRSISSNV